MFEVCMYEPLLFMLKLMNYGVVIVE